MLGGDFNVILSEEEKLGGLEFSQMEATDFAHCISACALSEVKFSGSKFTWWNARINEACIFERLDRILVNNVFVESFPLIESEHLIRQGSDHAPVQVCCNSVCQRITKSFRFLNFWCKHKKFMEIVQKNWVVNFKGCPFMELHAKLQKVKRVLSDWSKEEFGNIFMQIATLEDIIKVKEIQLEHMASPENRAELKRVEADLKRYQKFEEEYWKQKASMKWFVKGDRNTKFFHSSVFMCSRTEEKTSVV